jgi:hypothetical protein
MDNIGSLHLSGKGIFGDIPKVIDKMGENLKLMRLS